MTGLKHCLGVLEKFAHTKLRGDIMAGGMNPLLGLPIRVGGEYGDLPWTPGIGHMHELDDPRIRPLLKFLPKLKFLLCLFRESLKLAISDAIKTMEDFDAHLGALLLTQNVRGSPALAERALSDEAGHMEAAVEDGANQRGEGNNGFFAI